MFYFECPLEDSTGPCVFRSREIVGRIVNTPPGEPLIDSLPSAQGWMIGMICSQPYSIGSVTLTLYTRPPGTRTMNLDPVYHPIDAMGVSLSRPALFPQKETKKSSRMAARPPPVPRIVLCQRRSSPLSRQPAAAPVAARSTEYCRAGCMIR